MIKLVNNLNIKLVQNLETLRINITLVLDKIQIMMRLYIKKIMKKLR
jgi:hypothetical protein